MLRANLYKKFSKSNLPKAVDGVEQSNPSFEPMSLDRMMYPSEEINSKGLSVTPTKQPDLRSINLTGTAPLPSFGVKSSFFEGMSNPEMTVRGTDPGTRKVQTPQGEVYVQPGYVDSSEVDKAAKTQTKLKTPLDYNSMFTLGLGALDMGLGYNEDLKNQRILNESIQNRQSKPLYDYNYMYGRTTSGGTEYQPTIKAEMGAHITKRQNTPYGANNVEIEGGEFIQLPNFDTEHAEGPSHEQGGIKTSLPEGTRVYSDHLKPEGSKKTFAQLAKKYDISKFKETLDSPFKKQVDKDTANIMMTRNQKMLDELFAKQQSMNGDSNGEMRDGGIHNPGFMALPKAVQEKILANMEYGGYQLPEYGEGGKFSHGIGLGLPSLSPSQTRNYTKTEQTPAPVQEAKGPFGFFNSPKSSEIPSIFNPFLTNPNLKGIPDPTEVRQTVSTTASASNNSTTSSAKPKVTKAAQVALQNPDKSALPADLQPYANWDSGRKTWRVELPDNLESDQLGKIATAAEQFGIKNLVQSSNQRLATSSKDYEGFYGGMKPQDYERRIVEEKFGKDALKGLDEVGVRKKAFELLGIDPAKYDVNDAKKLYNDKKFRSEVLYPAFKSYLPKADFRKDQGDDFKLGLEHYDAIKTPKGTPTTTTTQTVTGPSKDASKDLPKGNEYKREDLVQKGRYTKQAFDKAQLIPDIYSLAESQTIFPYAIPEVDAPYLKPQTLNIQSELQDVDNMGTAAVRAGADPLSAYIAGLDTKQKAFQTKQNYDANARAQTDVANASSKMQTDQFNANAFNSVYNNLIASARDAQSAEKQASIANMSKNYADWNAVEQSKDFYYNNFIPAYNLDPNKTNEMTTANDQKFTRNTVPSGKKGLKVSNNSKKSLKNYKK